MKPHKGSSPFSVILSFMIMASNKITDFAFSKTLYMLIFHFRVDLKFLLLLDFSCSPGACDKPRTDQ